MDVPVNKDSLKQRFRKLLQAKTKQMHLANAAMMSQLIAETDMLQSSINLETTSELGSKEEAGTSEINLERQKASNSLGESQQQSFDPINETPNVVPLEQDEESECTTDNVRKKRLRSPSKRPMKRTRPSTSSFHAVVDKRERIANLKTENEDEFHTFGFYIASLLRKLPHNRSLSLQNKIHSLITEERINLLGDPAWVLSSTLNRNQQSYESLSTASDDS